MGPENIHTIKQLVERIQSSGQVDTVTQKHRCLTIPIEDALDYFADFQFASKRDTLNAQDRFIRMKEYTESGLCREVTIFLMNKYESLRRSADGRRIELHSYSSGNEFRHAEVYDRAPNRVTIQLYNLSSRPNASTHTWGSGSPAMAIRIHRELQQPGLILQPSNRVDS